MQFFYWNSSFEIGIPLIDAQHRRLVDLINELATAITDGGKLPRIEALIRELMDYAGKHFADEEKLLERAPLADGEKSRHREAHHGFVEKVARIAERDDLLQADVAEQVLEFLVTWLVSHILGSDRKIGLALKHDERGEAPARAIESSEIPTVEQVLIAALGETERRFRLISDYAPAMIWVCAPDGVRGYVNRSWCEFVGLDERRSLDCDWFDFVHPDDRGAYRERIGALLAAPRADEIEYRLRRGDGGYAWVLERILPRTDSSGSFMGLIASAVDVPAIKRSEEVLSRANRRLEEEVARRTEELERLMLTDPLTGIGNRRLLVERLEAAIERAGREANALAAVFIDLDHFKRINDLYGHPIGDRVLIRVAGCLRANLRDTDVVGRYGGEEFVVLLEGLQHDGALRLAERLRAAVGRIRLREVEVPVSASAGVALWRSGESADAFLARADQALYRAKQAGRDRCVMADGELEAA